jgi:hypothetical protein
MATSTYKGTGKEKRQNYKNKTFQRTRPGITESVKYNEQRGKGSNEEHS